MPTRRERQVRVDPDGWYVDEHGQHQNLWNQCRQKDARIYQLELETSELAAICMEYDDERVRQEVDEEQ